MKIQDFISATFEKISNNFPKASIAYQFDEKASIHYVKVSPHDVYDNETFVNVGWEIKDAFNDHFPDEELCFLTELSLIQLSSPSRILNPTWNEEILIEEGSFSISKTFRTEGSLFLQITNVDLKNSVSSTLSIVNSGLPEGNYQYAMAA
jgi:hypothetical protein